MGASQRSYVKPKRFAPGAERGLHITSLQDEALRWCETSGLCKGVFFWGGKPQLTPVPLPHRWLPLGGTPETSSMHPLHKLKGVQLTRTPGQEPWQPRGSRVHAYIFGRRKIKLHIFLKVITDTHLRAT